MTKRFLSEYIPTGTRQENSKYAGGLELEPGLLQIVGELGGTTYNNGIYRICTFNQIDPFTEMVEDYFPKLRGKVQVFGYDWLGRFFCLDQTTGSRNDSEIILVEPGAGDALEIPANIVQLHDSILVEHPEEALAKQFFFDWDHTSSRDLQFSDCVGYKVPLFLGGKDILENLEEIDITLYFSLCGQLWNKTKDLPKGQSIGSISMGSS